MDLISFDLSWDTLDLMSFDLSWDTLAVLKGGMIIHYSGADPSRGSGCTELLPCIVVFNWKKQAACALPQLWVLSHVSMVVPEHSYWAVRSTKIWLLTKTCSSLRLPAEATAMRKTVFKAKSLKEASRNGS